MRVSQTLSAVALLFVVASTAPAPAQDKPSLDDLIARLAAAKKERSDFLKKASDADKLAAELYREARELLESAGKKLDDLFGPPTPLPPGPGPVVPPTPPPVVDPLRKKVADAFAADVGSPADKKAWATTLAGYYEAAVETKMADDATLITAGDLLKRKRETVALSSDKLTGTRTVIGAELQILLGTAATPLSAETRKALPLLFTRIAAALDEVSK